MVKGFSKIYIFSFFGHFLLANIFTLQYNWSLQKKHNIFANLIFFQILKVEHKSFFNDVSFVKFGHKTWDLEVFKYPNRDRVKGIQS